METCRLEGAHLLIVNSELEARAIQSMWRKFPKIFNDWRNDIAYIGVHDIYKEGEFVTIFGKEFITDLFVLAVARLIYFITSIAKMQCLHLTRLNLVNK